MLKGKDIFQLSFQLYAIFSLLGASIAIGFVAMSHITFLLIFLYFIFSCKKSIIDISFNTLLVIFFLFLITLFLSILFNLEIINEPFHTLTKLKYFFIIVSLIYLLDRKKIKIKLSKVIIVISIISLLINLKSLYDFISGIQRIGGFAGPMNFPHNHALITTFLISFLFLQYKKLKFINIFFIQFVIISNIISICLSYTRGAWIALICSFFTILLFLKVKFINKLCITFICLFSVFLFTDFHNQIFHQSRSYSDNIRKELAVFGIEVATKNPFFGIGYKNFSNYLKVNHEKHSIKKYYHRFSGHAHNNYIEIASTAGFVSLLLFLIFLLLWIKINMAYYATKILFIPSIISIIISALTHYNFGTAENLTLITIFLAYNLIYYKNLNIEIKD